MSIINFSIDFTDQQLTGIAQARTVYNTQNSTNFTDVEYIEFVLLSAATSYAQQYSGSQPIDPSPIIPVADWNRLVMHILGGVLYPMYARLTAANFVDPITANQIQIAEANNIAVASGKIDQAVQVTKVEAAVQSAFQLLYQTSTYRFTPEEVDLWNKVTTELSFSDVIKLTNNN